MFSSVTRTLGLLARTPLVPAAGNGPAVVELTTFSTRSASTSAGPSRPRAASRTISNLSVKSAYGYQLESRRYASDKGQKELYSDEGGSTGAGTDDVAHTDAAFDKNADPASSAKKVEAETGKDFTKQSPASANYSHGPGEKGKPESGKPLNTSKENA